MDSIQLPTFRTLEFSIRPDIALGGYKTLLPPNHWLPTLDSRALGKRLPRDWSEFHYAGQHLARFEPTTVYANLVMLANYLKKNPDYNSTIRGLIAELIDYLLENTVRDGNARFVVRDYDFDRGDHIMSAGWVNGISNGFILRGLSRLYEVMKCPAHLALMHEFAAAYRIVNTPALRRVRPWFSYVDAEGLLWFDEHPTDDGTASIVINGHIHALYGLYYFRRHSDETWIDQMLKGAITAVRLKGDQFRVPGNVPRYDLRPGYKADYDPKRAIRQQNELFRITGDPWFAEMRDLLVADIAESDLQRDGRPLVLKRQPKPPFPKNSASAADGAHRREKRSVIRRLFPSLVINRKRPKLRGEAGKFKRLLRIVSHKFDE